MNFYPFHIGDYMSHTAHLEPMEDWAYRRMIDLYFVREACLPVDIAEVAKLIRMRSELVIVEAVLREFFKLTADGWVNSRCDYELGEIQSKRSKAKESAAKRWDSDGNAKAMPTHSERNATNTITNTITNTSKSKTAVEYPEAFEDVWREYPPRPGASKKDSFKAWGARVAAGVDPQVLHDGAVRYAKYCKASLTEPQFIKQATTFFGPNEHYLSDWTPPRSVAPPGKQANRDSYDAQAQEASERIFGHGRPTEIDITPPPG